MINEKLKARFSELQKELEDMPVATSNYPPTRYIEADVCKNGRRASKP